MSGLDAFSGFMEGENVWAYVLDSNWKIAPSGPLRCAHRSGQYCSVLNSREEAEEYVRATHILWEATHVS